MVNRCSRTLAHCGRYHPQAGSPGFSEKASYAWMCERTSNQYSSMVPACFPILTVLIDGLWLGRRSQTNTFLHETAIASVLFDLFICITATESKSE